MTPTGGSTLPGPTLAGLTPRLALHGLCHCNDIDDINNTDITNIKLVDNYIEGGMKENDVSYYP